MPFVGCCALVYFWTLRFSRIGDFYTLRLGFFGNLDLRIIQLRLFRTIRRQICSIDMIDIETFTNIFRLLNHVDRSIIEKYIQGYSIKSIADESEYSKAFVSERIYVFQNELKKEISKKQSKVKN